MANTDFRFDPFRQVFRPVVQTAEVHVAQYFDALGRVGFFTREAVQRRSPSSVVVRDATPATLSEVSRTTIPVYATYRIDYSALTFWSHCFVELHETRIGEVFTITYHGLGTGLNSSNRSDDRFNIERSVNVAGNAAAESLNVLGAAVLRGNTGLAIATAAELFMNLNRMQDVGDASGAADLVSLSKFAELVSGNGVEILSGSGNWTKPSLTRYVFFVLVGPGGDGHSAGGGGGGGASVYGIADLDAIGGDVFAYVVGVVGIATTMFGCSAGFGASASSATGASGGTGSTGPGVIGVGNPGGSGGTGYFLAVSSAASNPVMASVDGTAWAGYGGTVSIAWRRVAYGLGVIVSVAPTGVNASYSYNGSTWFTGSGCGAVLDVAFDIGVFVAVGNNAIYRSTDGINWSSQSVPQANNWIAITFGAGLFVAVADSGSNKVMTSPDGITWTLRTHVGATLYTGVTFGNGLFVAVGQINAGNAVMTSPDGITWTLQTTPVSLGVASDRWYAVAYGNGYYVAVSNYTLGGNYVMNSPDGINWTLRSVPELGNEWSDIFFGAGVFVAVSSTGSNRTMYSTDGTTWTAVAASAANTWFGGAYIPAGGGGNSAGGFGLAGESATLGEAGIADGFFQGKGGIPSAPDGGTYGGGGAVDGVGAVGTILLIY